MPQENTTVEVAITPELKAKFDEMGTMVEALRKKNDQLEAQRQKDGITKEELNRINEAVSSQETTIKQIETALQRKDKGSLDGTASDVDATEYKAAMSSYLRKGNDTAIAELQAKAMSVNSEEDGGYTVTPEMSGNISKVIQEISPMRQLASVETIGSDSLLVLVDKDLMGYEWVGETEDGGDTDTPGFGKIEIKVHELAATPKATQKLLDDSSLDIEAWLANKVSETFAKGEAASFINGDGVGKPSGILNYADGTTYGKIERINAGSTTAITADNIYDLFYGLKDDYASNASFLMKRATLKNVRLLKEATTNAYIWQPGLAAGQPQTLAGQPVQECVDMPAVASGAVPIAFGDFRRGYQIVDRVGVRVLRDPFTSKPFVKFYTTKRVGGAVINFEAIKLLEMAA